MNTGQEEENEPTRHQKANDGVFWSRRAASGTTLMFFFVLGVAEGGSTVTRGLEYSGREKGQERSLAGLRSL